MKQLLVGILITIWVATANAGGQLKPFHDDSMNQIEMTREGKPFLLVLWSIDCPPCLKELAQIQQLRERFSNASLVLISTDHVRDSDSIKQLLNKFQLTKMDNWVFSDSMPERLRYRIDPSWYGELPRAYFYNASHQRREYSGRLTSDVLDAWLNK